MQSGSAAVDSGRTENSAVPSLFRKDRLRLQCVGLLCLAYSISSKVSVFDHLGALTARASSPFPLDSFGLPLFDRIGLPFEFPPWMVYSAVVVLVVAACRESLRFPRCAAHASTTDAVRTILLLAGDLILIPYYLLARPEVPDVRFQPTERNKHLVAQCPSLAEFKQTVWLRNSNLAFLVLMLFDASADQYRKFVRRELLPTADGGTVALDWWEDRPDVAKSTKILFIGSTFTGDTLATPTRLVCQRFSALGWRVVVMVKRGCGRSMPNEQPGVCRDPKCFSTTSAKPWCLMGPDDFELAVDHVAQSFPGVPICSVGLSTGGGQLRGYFNRKGDRSKIVAGVVVDAAPTWRESLDSLDARLPLISKALVIAARDSFLNCGDGFMAPGSEGALAGGSDEAREGEAPIAPVPGGLLSFVCEEMATKNGFAPTSAGALAYFRHTQPPASSCCAVPCLELMTFDDQLIEAEKVQELQQYYKLSPNVITAATKQGTHAVHWEGLRPACWVSRVASEFLGSALAVKTDVAQLREAGSEKSSSGRPEAQ